MIKFLNKIVQFKSRCDFTLYINTIMDFKRVSFKCIKFEYLY